MSSNSRLGQPADSKPPRLRFAPSPTGALHIGGARTALFNYLFARRHGGTLILRIDDTDAGRSKPEFEADIVSSLTWLGLRWDEGPDCGGPAGKYRQSERRERHLECAEKLLTAGAAYRDPEGTIRLRYLSETIIVDDAVCGRCEFPASSLGPEPVLVKSDGAPTYHLSTVADDIDMQVSHVIRGQDHLTNTAKHQLIFKGLGADLPVFAHLPLILGDDGSKLSKRNSTGLISVADFRCCGYLPEALINFLVLLGWSHPGAKEVLTIDQAEAEFSLDRVSHTAAVFDSRRLDHLNGLWIRAIDPVRLLELAQPFGGEFIAELQNRAEATQSELVKIMQGEITSLSEVAPFLASVFQPEIAIDTAAVTEAAGGSGDNGAVFEVIKAWHGLIDSIPAEDGSDSFSAAQFAQILSALKKNVNVPQKLLFKSLRLAIFGRLTGPELKLLIPYIPRGILLNRAQAALALK